MGRPKKPIDRALVGRAATIGCTNEEIAALVGCSADTIERRFAGTLRIGRAKLKMSLRRRQVKAAKAGDRLMLIWLGKQYLGQTDKQAVTHEVLAALYVDPREKHGSSTVATPGGEVAS